MRIEWRLHGLFQREEVTATHTGHLHRPTGPRQGGKAILVDSPTRASLTSSVGT